MKKGRKPSKYFYEDRILIWKEEKEYGKEMLSIYLAFSKQKEYPFYLIFQKSINKFGCYEDDRDEDKEMVRVSLYEPKIILKDQLLNNYLFLSKKELAIINYQVHNYRKVILYKILKRYWRRMDDDQKHDVIWNLNLNEPDYNELFNNKE